MISRRRIVIAIGASTLATPFGALAQQQAKVWRIGFLGSSSAVGMAGRIEALKVGLTDFGYIDGKNIKVDYRWADDKYERLAALAADLVREQVDLIVTHGTPGTQSAKQATTSIPIVMALSGDAIATGLVASLAKPGGNITGMTFFDPELSAKRIDVLKDALPNLRRLAVITNPANSSATGPSLRAIESAAASMKVNLYEYPVKGPGAFADAFASMVKNRIEAVAVLQDPMTVSQVKALAALGNDNRLPSIGFPELAEAGGLLGYGVDGNALYRRAGYFVDRIIKGAKPGDLPIEQPTKFEMVINLKTAKALGIKIPQSIMVQATKVIE